MITETIPFNRPYRTGRELAYIADVLESGRLAGGGEYSRRCQEWIERETGCHRALLTHSCTAALEMAALLIDIQPGDEVIMPSFTFVSTANAFVLRGAVPVFVDVRADTLNLNEQLVEAAVTSRTRAVVAVHYAGVACEMDALAAVAARHDLWLIEDAAQGVRSAYRGRALGAIGDLGAFSFHATKNLGAGEGGALLVNDPELAKRAEILREKGTNRSAFLRGQVDKYTWVDVGSSFLPSEITAACLWAQLESADEITGRRLQAWTAYAEGLAGLPAAGVQLPAVPAHCRHNAHIFFLLLADAARRDRALGELTRAGVQVTSHYVPLHSSPKGAVLARRSGSLAVTEAVSSRLLRLPLWSGMAPAQIDAVVAAVNAACR